MTLNITKGDTPIPVEHVNLLIYAPPGHGKTSLAFSAESPLLLDFDGGVHRSGFRKDAVRIQHWTEVSALTPADLKDYTTIIVDTSGRALDMLTASLQEDNPKLRTRHGGLTLPGYGELKSAFATWVNLMRTLGKDIVMVAHEKEERRGEDTVFRADMQGGSYAEVFKLADGVGYMTIDEHGRRVIDFEPSVTHSGKNPAKLEAVTYDLHQNPDILADIIKATKAGIGNIGAQSKAVADEVNEFRKRVNKIKNAKGMNKLLKELGEHENKGVVAQVKRLMKNRNEVIGVVWDKDKKKFADTEKPEKEAKAEKPAKDKAPESEDPADDEAA